MGKYAVGQRRTQSDGSTIFDIDRYCEVNEDGGSANFFHFHDFVYHGATVVHRHTGGVIGCFLDPIVNEVMDALEDCGVDWSFTDMNSADYKLADGPAMTAIARFPRQEGKDFFMACGEGCEDDCGHSKEEHKAFDEGLEAGADGALSSTCPYSHPFKGAWLTGHSVGCLGRKE